MLTFAKIKTMADCEFDRLFTRGVPHILEKIFFSLDYNSFVACREVSNAWNELHSSEFFRRKAELIYSRTNLLKYQADLFHRFGKVDEAEDAKAWVEILSKQ